MAQGIVNFQGGRSAEAPTFLPSEFYDYRLGSRAEWEQSFTTGTEGECTDLRGRVSLGTRLLHAHVFPAHDVFSGDP